MAVLALGLFLVWFLVVFVARTVMHRRATGDSGVRTGALSAPPGSIEWTGGWMLVLALLSGVMAPVSELLVLDPIVASDPLRIGVVIAVTGIGLTFLAQSAMGTEWRIGVDAEERTGLVLLVTSVELQVRYVEEPHLRRLHGAAYGAYES